MLIGQREGIHIVGRKEEREAAMTKEHIGFRFIERTDSLSFCLVFKGLSGSKEFTTGKKQKNNTDQSGIPKPKPTMYF